MLTIKVFWPEHKGQTAGATSLSSSDLQGRSSSPLANKNAQSVNPQNINTSGTASEMFSLVKVEYSPLSRSQEILGREDGSVS